MTDISTRVDHTAKAFDVDLQEITRKVAEMGGLAERQISDATRALVDRDADLAERVIATDPSAQQIGNAGPHPRVEYRVEPGERSAIPARSMDAITVAQALHWFDLPRFVEEVQRLAKPGALFAAWSYAGCNVTPQVDAVIAHLYDDMLGAYWPPERRLVDEGYASLALPFEPVLAPAFEMRVEWDAEQLLAYLSSWSAAQRFHAATGRDATAEIADALRTAWGDPQQARSVRWNLGLRAGRVK